MSQHSFVFVKDFKKVDEIWLNYPSMREWESKQIERYIERYAQHYSQENKQEFIEHYIDSMLTPFIRIIPDEEAMIKVYKREVWKKNVVTLVYRKAEGWDGDSEKVIDSSKDYDFVIYNYEDGFDLNEGNNFELLMNLIRNADGLRIWG